MPSPGAKLSATFNTGNPCAVHPAPRENLDGAIPAHRPFDVPMAPPITNVPQARGVAKWTLLATGLASLALACDFEPEAEPLHFRLSEISAERLVEAEQDGTVRSAAALGAQTLGALEMLFGTPSAPQYLVLEDWADEDRDPTLGGFAELDDEAFERVREENRNRFRLQLELIEQRRYAEVAEPSHAADLWRIWEAEYLPGLVGEDADPDAPFVEGDDDYGTRHEEAVALFEGWYPTLRESSEFYRIQCLHCHGVEGGGNGPTAPYLEPRPRDYRLGIFKWIGVDRNQRPRRADLLHILQQGVTGTAMPSFARFSRGELEGLIDYVRLLALRGEVERYLIESVADQGFLPAESVLESYELAWSNWDDAAEKYVFVDGEVPRPSDVTHEMLEHGRELFLGDVANCYTCHGTDGRGDGASLMEEDPYHEGQMRRRLDEWGQAREQAGILANAGFETKSRNFQQAIFRGGSRPLDLFRRLKYGISGTIMPAADASLSDEDIWSLVYYVLSIAEEHDVARSFERSSRVAEHSEGHGVEEHGTADHE